ncbi:MAG: alpha/beta hydrolase [Clostridia bacterium]
MSLSLELKKFINSEHTGEYVDIILPYGTRGEEMTVKMHYMDEGTGEPLILVHSFAQSIYTWNKLYKSLSEHYRVVAVDLFGHGHSDCPKYFEYNIEDHVNSLLLLMDALNIKSAHFLGFSMGTGYCLALAQKHPERVGRMVLMSPGGITPEMPPALRMLKSPILGSWFSATLNEKIVENVLNECFLDLTTVTNERIDGYYSILCDKEQKKAIRKTVRNFDDEDLASALRSIDVPTLILWPSEDKWHTLSMAELYHAAMKDASFAVIRNAGHLLHEEKPEKILAAVLEFIPSAMPKVEA